MPFDAGGGGNVNDPNRVFAGFVSMEGGMDGGRSASLIQDNQCAMAGNVTFRGAFPKTRPPYENLLLTFDSDLTESRFTGIFQGSVFYEAEFGSSGFVVSVGGKLFRIQLGQQNIVSEITPTLIIVTTAAFTVPALNNNVTVDVNSETLFEVGDIIFIDSGQYQVQNKSTDQILVEYQGGAANATASAGNQVLDASSASIIEYQANPSNFDFVHLFQAENYIIILAGQHKPIIYDGARARQANVDEVPPGVIGIYVWGRIWVTLPNRRSFVAGDIVYGPSGTAQNGLRDAILKFTENDFLSEGGAFTVPFNAGPITAMQALATQDTSLGVGNLLVGTTNMVFSVNTPIDRTTWKNLQYPIQTVSLLDYGPRGPRSTISVNGDMWYRSEDGARSFIVARRNIDVTGNTPMSREVSPILDVDTEDLLFFGSAVLFNNKGFSTVSPYRTDAGVAHRGFTTINLDMLSNLRGKLPPAWEGVQSGLNAFQILKGRVEGEERGFVFALGDDGSTIELWELLKDDQGFYDTFRTAEGENTSITRTAIQSFLETKSYDHQTPFNVKGLYMAELYLDEIVDNVAFAIKFRPDQYPTWVPWTTINLCATVTQCTVQAPGAFSCTVWKTNKRQYAARIRIPRPPETCNTIAGAPVDRGFEFQFRMEWTGHCRIRRFRAHSKFHSQESEGVCPSENQCSTFQACDDSLFTYDSHGT